MTFTENARRLADAGAGVFTVEQYADDSCWLVGRRNGIGASEAASVMGMSPWCNEVDLWMEKALGKEREFKGNPDTERGHRSEYHIRDLYAIEMGCEVIDGTHIMMRSVKYPWMTCTLDGIVVTPDGMVDLEIKSVKFSHGEWSGDKIPDYYFIQLLHQLAVTGWNEARLLVRFSRNEGWEGASERIYHVYRKDVEEQIAKLIERERRFWEYNVMQKKKPAVRMPTI